MQYLPLTPQDERKILARLGVPSFDALIDQIIPPPVQFRRAIGLPPAASEDEVRSILRDLAGANRSTEEFTSYLGAGVYDHYQPAVVNDIISRSEFYTAYTPYQAEVSQGTLQAIFEYQSVICELTGLGVSNASMYDGGSALAEACHMANTIKNKGRIILSDLIHPFYRRVVQTYTQECCIEIATCPGRNGALDLDALRELLKEDASCVAVQQPNFFGYLEDMAAIEPLVHGRDGLLIAVVDPLSLGVIAPPAEYQADICVGEGQGMGISQGFGGPLLGVFAARPDFARFMPGRIVGETVDLEGKRGYVLTLQTREQHIRREKATSNICTNEALCALSSLVYLCTLGKQGIVELGQLCLAKSHYLRERLAGSSGVRPLYGTNFFKEFIVETDRPAREIVDRMLEKGILAGVPLSRFDPGDTNRMIVAVTERRTREDMDRYIEALTMR